MWRQSLLTVYSPRRTEQDRLNLGNIWPESDIMDVIRGDMNQELWERKAASAWTSLLKDGKVTEEIRDEAVKYFDLAKEHTPRYGWAANLFIGTVYFAPG
ncbi:MAG: hypothetical protein IJR85_01830 [Synergistaceae bacterium]|nr:hypothetical protein [Synergistaceae bacterium]